MAIASKLLILIILVGFSALFSAAETALFSLSKAQLQRLRERRPTRGEIILFLLDHPRRVLSTVLLGNASVNTAACILALGLFEGQLLLTIIVMVLVLLVLGEIVPKTFARQNAEAIVNLTARPIYWMTQLSSPVRLVLEKLGYWMVPRLTPETFKPTPHITQEEFRAMIEIGREQGVLQESERKMIHAIMQLGDKTVKEVMTPRVDMVCLADNLTHDEITSFLKQVKHRRVPIYDETPDTIVGILDVKKFLMNPERDLTEVMDVPAFVPERMNAAKLLKNFQQQKRQMAIVVDEFGGTEGLVTVEDIVEEIVGEVADEYDPRDLLVEQLASNRFVVSGRMRLEDLNEQLKLGLTAEDVDTIGGFVASRLGRVPKPGEKMVVEGISLTARRVVRNRVLEVLIEREEKR
jgi:putative hemolysin